MLQSTRNDFWAPHKYSIDYREMIIFTGSIARNATRRYLIYSQADFEVFRPAGATRCTDGVKFGTKEGLG